MVHLSFCNTHRCGRKMRSIQRWRWDRPLMSIWSKYIYFHNWANLWPNYIDIFVSCCASESGMLLLAKGAIQTSVMEVFFLLWCSYFLVMRGKRFELHRYKNALYTPSSSHENSRKMKLVRLFFLLPYVSVCFFCRIQFAALKLLAFWYCFRICLSVRRDYMLFFFSPYCLLLTQAFGVDHVSFS